jgi:hypothetical protein
VRGAEVGQSQDEDRAGGDDRGRGKDNDKGEDVGIPSIYSSM